MAIDEGILKLVFARNNIPNLTMEAYLSSRPGVIGAIGFQKIAESHAAETKKAELAESELTSLVNDAARIFHGLEPGAAVTAEQQNQMKKDIKRLAAMSIDDRKIALKQGLNNDDVDD